MRQLKFFGLGFVAVLAIGGYVEHARYMAGTPTTMRHTTPGQVAMAPAPIRKDWVIEGQPKTEVGEIAHSSDGFNQVYIWQTTKSRFHWNYEFDETITIVDGDVFITDESGRERHLKPGDIAFFPVGAKTVWNVPDHLRKVAVVKRPVPGMVASAIRWMRNAKGWIKPSSAFAGDQPRL